jgi:hypothetical protein
MDQGSVNGQIVDSVADVVALNSGIAPTQAFGMLDSVMTETLGMAMYNAVSRQQGSSMIGSAATTAVCAKMLSAPFPFEIPPPPPPPPAPPAPPPSGGVEPLAPPPPKPPPPAAAIIAAAKAEGEWAIKTLKAEEIDLIESAEAARDALVQLTANAPPTVAAAVAAAATAEAEAGIDYLQKVAGDPSNAGQKKAQAQLTALAAAAKNIPPQPDLDPDEVGKAAEQAIAALQQLAAGTPDPADAANARAALAKLGTEATPPKK